MTFNSILDLTFPRVEARWIITYRSSPTGFSRFLLRGGRPLVIRRTSLGSAISSSRHWRTGSTLFQIPTDEHGLYLLCNYFPTRPRQHSSRLFSPPFLLPLPFSTVIPRHVSNKSHENASPGNESSNSVPSFLHVSPNFLLIGSFKPHCFPLIRPRVFSCREEIGQRAFFLSEHHVFLPSSRIGSPRISP